MLSHCDESLPVLMPIERHRFRPPLASVHMEKVAVVHVRVQIVYILLVPVGDKNTTALRKERHEQP